MIPLQNSSASSSPHHPPVPYTNPLHLPMFYIAGKMSSFSGDIVTAEHPSFGEGPTSSLNDVN